MLEALAFVFHFCFFVYLLFFHLQLYLNQYLRWRRNFSHIEDEMILQIDAIRMHLRKKTSIENLRSCFSFEKKKKKKNQRSWKKLCVVVFAYSISLNQIWSFINCVVRNFLTHHLIDAKSLHFNINIKICVVITHWITPFDPIECARVRVHKVRIPLTQKPKWRLSADCSSLGLDLTRLNKMYSYTDINTKLSLKLSTWLKNKCVGKNFFVACWGCEWRINSCNSWPQESIESCPCPFITFDKRRIRERSEDKVQLQPLCFAILTFSLYTLPPQLSNLFTNDDRNKVVNSWLPTSNYSKCHQK